MSVFERFLTLWVLACIVVGVVLGQFAPEVFQAIGGLEVARVNLPVGVLIWVMVVPMLLRVDFAALGQVRRHWRGISVTLFVNWAVKPHCWRGFSSGTCSPTGCRPTRLIATLPD